MEKKARQFLEALKHEQILQIIPSGLFLVDPHRHVVYWSPEAERITGYPADEAVGRHCSFLEGIECGQGCTLFDADTPEKPVIGNECHVRTRDGRQITIIKNVDLVEQDGNVVGGIESFVDITPQKELEEELRRHGEKLEQTVHQRTEALEQERSRLRSVLDAMQDPAYIVTEDYRIDFMNRAMQEEFGENNGEFCYTLLHGTSDVCENCPWPQVRKGRSVNEERIFGNNQRVYEVVHTPVHTPRGKIQKLAVCRDITERKESADKLEELNRHLDSFVYTVSHDLRSPLTPIIGFAEFLREEYRDRLDEQAVSLLREIENQGGRMLRLMEDLLDLSRVGQVPPPTRPVSVAKVVDQVLQDNQSDIIEKGIKVVTGDLPQLMIPETMIYELFNNLVANAVRYGAGPGDEIEIGSSRENGHHILFVRDHGPGIPEAEREKVCNVFFRGSAAESSPGTGIGLATVHKIVRLYDGAIRFEDTPGGGCTVLIRFPVNK